MIPSRVYIFDVGPLKPDLTTLWVVESLNHRYYARLSAPYTISQSKLTALSNQRDDLVLLDIQIQPLQHLNVLLGRVCEPHPPDLYLWHLLLACRGHLLHGLCLGLRWYGTALTVDIRLVVHDFHHFLRGTDHLRKLLACVVLTVMTDPKTCASIMKLMRI